MPKKKLPTEFCVRFQYGVNGLMMCEKICWRFWGWLLIYLM
jgi:hypothetical protein